MRRRSPVLYLTVMGLLWGLSHAARAETLNFYRYPLAHMGYYPHQSVNPSPKPYKKYGLVNIGTHDAGKSSPIVADGVIYVGTDFGFLMAIRETDTTPLWRFPVRPVRQGIHATPALDRDRVYIGAYDGWLYAVNRATGQLVWQTQLGHWIGSSPVIWRDRIYVGVETQGPNGYLSCVHRDTGELLFRSAKFGDHTHSTPAINTATATVFIGANSRRFFALDARDGQTKWVFKTGAANKSTAALFEDAVLFTSWDGYLYKLSQQTGELIWRFKTQDRSMSSPAIDPVERIVYAGSHDRHLYAVGFDDGEQRWAYRTGKAVTSSPIVGRNAATQGKMVIFGSADKKRYGLNAATGRLHFRFATRDYVNNVPFVNRQRIYVSSKDGWIYVLQ